MKLSSLSVLFINSIISFFECFFSINSKSQFFQKYGVQDNTIKIIHVNTSETFINTILCVYKIYTFNVEHISINLIENPRFLPSARIH